MTPSAESGLLSMLLIGWGVGLLLGLGIYVWYAVALSRLFPRLGGEAWKGWVPILNEAEILARGGVAAWKVVFYLIPIVQIYGIYLKVIATHRINQQFGRGAGSTVLAILLPPVWATILAAGAPPYPEGDRLAALQPGPRRTPQPLLEPTTGDTRDYALPAFAPQRPASAHAGAAPSGGFIPAPRSTNAGSEASAPPAGNAGIPAEWQAFAPAPQAPASAPQPPVPQSSTPEPSVAAPSEAAPQPPAPAPQPPAPSFAPPTAPAPQPPVVSAPAAPPAAPPAPAAAPVPLAAPAAPAGPAEEFPLPPAFAPTPPVFTPPAPPAAPAATVPPVTETPAPGIRPVPLIATPPVAPAAPTETSAAEALLAHDAESDDLLADDLAQTIIKPRQVAVDDDLEATVVVARKRGVRRSLVLDDGRSFALSGASVVIGRNPVGDPGEQRLSITDATRTLSKTHARLVVTDDEWRLTDLHATNGVVVVAEDGTEVLLDPGESVVGTGRFILGEVGMHVIAERDS
ncbi:FHA domain-containing protein [Microbacterium sp. kSW2-24]|uniref:DUF5684 domain-containing protein n=1 Tax=Microbacterium galbinum TaxID=2851646 RepID=UPI001FFD7EF0|nr:DUF5684 domain-containing protein [Microbacterium galbinum]MCK2022890.1 FHA domain-containing protein [Microbacterium galbinum]